MSSHPRRKRKKSGSHPGAWFGIIKAEMDEDRERRGEPPDLHADQVLAWADAYLARTGRWPQPTSGPIPEAPGETWMLVAAALALGLRGFPPKGSIPRFLKKHRGRYNMRDQELSIGQIIDCADAWHAERGVWPLARSDKIPGAGGASWHSVDRSLRLGLGGLPGGSCLAHLLATERGVLVPYTEEEILQWADAFHARTGRWPRPSYGPIAEAPGETWCGVNMGLLQGLRGLPGGSSLARLLIEKRGVRNVGHAPVLTISQILAWADAHRQRTGRWPVRSSGPIPEAPGETWAAVHVALRGGLRSLPGGLSLAKLQVERRPKRRVGYARSLSIPLILEWADAFRARDGRWPTASSGPVAEAPEETWAAIDSCLFNGIRGLDGGLSLSRLLARERSGNLSSDRLSLTISEILRWADAHHLREGVWPGPSSGPIPEAPAKTWEYVNDTIRRGRCGLPAGTTLVKVLSKERGARCPGDLPPLNVADVLAWCDAHRARTGKWPSHLSGPIPEAPGETWSLIYTALRRGHRGIGGGSTIGRLIAQSGRFHPRVKARYSAITDTNSTPAALEARSPGPA
jgi:hypothetical protein